MVLHRLDVLADVPVDLLHLLDALVDLRELSPADHVLVELLQTDDACHGCGDLLQVCVQSLLVLVVDVDDLVLEQRRSPTERVHVLLHGGVDLQQRVVLLLGERLQHPLQLHLLAFDQSVGVGEGRVQLLVVLLGDGRQRDPLVSRDGALARVALRRVTVVAVVLQLGVGVVRALHRRDPQVAAAHHQTLDVLDVEVCLQGCDAGRRDVGDLATRRTLDLVADMLDVFTQAVFAEGVVTRQELGLVVVVVEETSTDEAHQDVFVALESRSHRRSLHHFDDLKSEIQYVRVLKGTSSFQMFI